MGAHASVILGDLHPDPIYERAHRGERTWKTDGSEWRTLDGRQASRSIMHSSPPLPCSRRQVRNEYGTVLARAGRETMSHHVALVVDVERVTQDP